MTWLCLRPTGAHIGDNTSAGIGLKFIRSNLADAGAGIERGRGVGNSFAADLGFYGNLFPASALARPCAT